MRRSTRNFVRTAVPSILALGLVTLAIRPICAAPVGAAGDASADSPLAVTGGQHTTCPRHDGPLADKDPRHKTHGTANRMSAPPTGSVEVSIPSVAFSELIRVVNGRVRTPVLVNAAESCGVATVIGSPGRCTVVAQPGVVAWLDCALPKQHSIVIIEVRLADGTRFTHAAAPTTS